MKSGRCNSLLSPPVLRIHPCRRRGPQVHAASPSSSSSPGPGPPPRLPDAPRAPSFSWTACGVRIVKAASRSVFNDPSTMRRECAKDAGPSREAFFRRASGTTATATTVRPPPTFGAPHLFGRARSALRRIGRSIRRRPQDGPCSGMPRQEGRAPQVRAPARNLRPPSVTSAGSAGAPSGGSRQAWKPAPEIADASHGKSTGRMRLAFAREAEVIPRRARRTRRSDQWRSDGHPSAGRRPAGASPSPPRFGMSRSAFETAGSCFRAAVPAGSGRRLPCRGNARPGGAPPRASGDAARSPPGPGPGPGPGRRD